MIYKIAARESTEQEQTIAYRQKIGEIKNSLQDRMQKLEEKNYAAILTIFKKLLMLRI